MVINDLRDVEPPLAQRLFEKTKWLASNAENLSHEPAASTLPDISQYAVGDWRILYSVDRGEHLVVIHMIGKRDSVYPLRHHMKSRGDSDQLSLPQ